jgi:hypothetical protein
VAAVLLYLALLGAVGLMGLYAAQASLDGLHVAVEHHVRELSLLDQIGADVGLYAAPKRRRFRPGGASSGWHRGP